MQNDLNMEKVINKTPQNESEKHYMLQKLTEKINFIKNELVAFDANIQNALDHVKVLEESKKAREARLKDYEAKKAEVLKLTFEDKPKEEVIKEEQPQEDIKVKELKAVLEKKGFSLDDLITTLEKKK